MSARADSSRRLPMTLAGSFVRRAFQLQCKLKQISAEPPSGLFRRAAVFPINAHVLSAQVVCRFPRPSDVNDYPNRCFDFA